MSNERKEFTFPFTATEWFIIAVLSLGALLGGVFAWWLYSLMTMRF
jgi:hypothetical protein